MIGGIFDIIDTRMPGLLRTIWLQDGTGTRRELAKQLAEIDASIGPETPSDEWIAEARDIDLMAACMRYWRKPGAPRALLARVDEFAADPDVRGRLFSQIRRHIQVH